MPHEHTTEHVFDALQDLTEMISVLSTNVDQRFDQVDKRFDRVDQRLEHLEHDVSELKNDVSILKTDVAGLKTDVAVLKTDVAGLKTDVSKLKTDMETVQSGMVTKDYLDEKVTDLRGDLVVLVRKEDRKLAALVDALVERKVLDHAAATRILALEPFAIS